MDKRHDTAQNCWDVMACGKGPATTFDAVCPAATESRLNGQNRGLNGGRACWVVANTLCGGTVQGSFSTKLTTCGSCEFFVRVAKDERPNAAKTGDLLRLIG